MNGSETLQSIREINLSYLSLAQHLLREDRAEGMSRLGLSAPLAELLSELSAAQTDKLAACDQLLCYFRFNDQAMLATLAAPARHALPSFAEAALVKRVLIGY
jgi:flagellar transcriptional activator FlhD